MTADTRKPQFWAIGVRVRAGGRVYDPQDPISVTPTWAEPLAHTKEDTLNLGCPAHGVVADVDVTEVRLTDEVFERTSPQSTTFLLRTNEGPLIT